MVQVYSEAYCRRHYASRCSSAYCLRVITHVLAFVLSCIIAYNTGGLWTKSAVEFEQPNVAFTYDALMVLEGTTLGQEKMWSSLPGLNALFGSQAASVRVQAAEDDLNFDGTSDMITFQALCPGVGPVHAVKLLLQFRYQLQESLNLRMYSLAYIQHSSGIRGGALYTDGELRLRQSNPIREGGYVTHYDTPILTDTGVNGTAIQVSSHLQLENLLSNYLDRNETTVYDFRPVWKAGQTDDFSITAKIRIPPNELVLLRPQRLGMVKFAWVQILSIYAVLLFLLTRLEGVIFRNQIVTTRVGSDFQPPKQKF